MKSPALKVFHVMVPIFPVLGVILLWECIARSGVMSSFLLPRFTVVLERIAEDVRSGDLTMAIALTCGRALAGFAIAAVLGLATGIGMAASRGIRWFFEPIISVGFPTPKIAFLPVFMLWLGLGDVSKIAIAAVSCYFIITSNAYAGASGVERQLLWAARSLGGGGRSILYEIILPAALPQIITGLQIALPISLIVALASEMIMGGGGIGGMLLDASRYADLVGLFAGIVEIAILGTILIRGLAFLRRHLLGWHAESQPVTS